MTDPDAVVAEIRPRRAPRHRWSGLELGVGLPLMLFALLVAVAVVVFSFLYAVAGTDPPLLVNARGDRDGQAPTGARIEAAVVCVAFLAMVAGLLRVVLRQRMGAEFLVVDGRGVWLTRREHVQEGLSWSEIEAVTVADARVELYPLAKVDPSPSPLGRRVVNAQPGAPGLRGKRYAIELTDRPGAADAIRAAVARFAPDRQLTA